MLAHAAVSSEELKGNGYLRTQFTSSLVGDFIRNIQVEESPDGLKFYNVNLENETLMKVETLKHLTYEMHVQSAKLKVSAYRGRQIIRTIFDSLDPTSQNGGSQYLMPDDYRNLYENMNDEADKKRVICDFIAGMTDRYALEFYGRLVSESPESIFKPI